MVGQRGIEFGQQLGKGDEVAAISPIERLQQEAGGQAALAAAGRSQPDDVLLLGHVVEAVVERHDPLAVQLRLAGEGERLDLQHLGDVGPFAAQQPGVLAS